MPRFGEFVSDRSGSGNPPWTATQATVALGQNAPDGSRSVDIILQLPAGYRRCDTLPLDAQRQYGWRACVQTLDGLPHKFNLAARELAGGVVAFKEFTATPSPQCFELVFTPTGSTAHILALGGFGAVADVGVVFRAWNFSCSAVEQDFTSYFEHDGDSATVEHLVFRGGNAFSHFGNAWTKVGAPQAVQMGGFSGGPAGVLPGASGYFEAPVGMPNLLDLCTGDFIGGVVYLRPTTQDCQLLGNNVANTGFNILHGAANFTVMFIGSALVNEAGLALSEGLNVTTFGRLGPNGILKTNRRVLRSGPHSNPTASAGPFRVGRGNGGSSPTLEGGIFEMWLSKRSPRGIAEFTTVNEMVLRKMGQ